MAIVLRAKTAGFCMGVGLALRKLDQAIKEHRSRSSGRLVMLGPIIHNPQVMNTYMQQGSSSRTRLTPYSRETPSSSGRTAYRAKTKCACSTSGRMSLTRHALKSSRRSSPSTRPPGRDFPLPVRRGRASGSAGARLLCQRPMPRVWELEGIERKTDVQRYPQCGAGGSNPRRIARNSKPSKNLSRKGIPYPCLKPSATRRAGVSRKR